MALPSSDRSALSAYASGVELLELLERHISPKDSLPRVVAVAARLTHDAAGAAPAGTAATGGVPEGTTAGGTSCGDLKAAPRADATSEGQPAAAGGSSTGSGRSAGVSGKPAPAPSQASAPRCTIPDLGFSTPFGKFTAKLMDSLLVLTNAKGEVAVPLAAVEHVAILDRYPKDAKERVVIFIALDPQAGVTSGKQTLEALVLNTLADSEMRVEVQEPGGGGAVDVLEGPTPVVLCSVLGRAGVGGAAFVSPDEELFSSSKGRPAVSATHKASAGWLYPLPSALYFVERPPMCLPHERIAGYEITPRRDSFELALHLRPRGGGGGGSKLSVVELSIDVSELSRVQAYLSRCKLKTVEAGGSGGGGGSALESKHAFGERDSGDSGDDDDEDEDEDDDFDPEASDHSDGGRPPGRTAGARRRTAPVDPNAAGPSTSTPGAIVANEDDEDDEEASGSESESESDDDDGVELIDEEDFGIRADAIRGCIDKDRGEARRGTKRKAAQ